MFDFRDVAFLLVALPQQSGNDFPEQLPTQG
jgi:hypothetical protein